MSTHDNAPPPADWTPCVGNRCAGCDASRNLCRVLDAQTSATCCTACSHETTVTRIDVAYYGD